MADVSVPTREFSATRAAFLAPEYDFHLTLRLFGERPEKEGRVVTPFKITSSRPQRKRHIASGGGNPYGPNLARCRLTLREFARPEDRECRQNPFWLLWLLG